MVLKREIKKHMQRINSMRDNVELQCYQLARTQLDHVSSKTVWGGATDGYIKNSVGHLVQVLNMSSGGRNVWWMRPFLIQLVVALVPSGATGMCENFLKAQRTNEKRFFYVVHSVLAWSTAHNEVLHYILNVMTSDYSYSVLSSHLAIQ